MARPKPRPMRVAKKHAEARRHGAERNLRVSASPCETRPPRYAGVALPPVGQQEEFTWLKRPARRDRRRWRPLVEFLAGGEGAGLGVRLDVHVQARRALPSLRWFRVVRRGGGAADLASADLLSLPLALIVLSESVRHIERLAGQAHTAVGAALEEWA